MAKINKNAGNKNVKTPTNVKAGVHLQSIKSPSGNVGGVGTGGRENGNRA